MVGNLRDARNRPYGLLGGIPVRPGSDATPKRYSISIQVDDDTAGIQFRMATKRLLNLFFQFANGDPGADRYQVRHARNSIELGDCFLGSR